VHAGDVIEDQRARVQRLAIQLCRLVAVMAEAVAAQSQVAELPRG
jgi:hypothetical protein